MAQYKQFILCDESFNWTNQMLEQQEDMIRIYRYVLVF
jgi:hypothetical protein